MNGGDPIIRVSNLERAFGDVRAVCGISFDVQAGEVIGFIGANGAGKTTTMRMMATLDIPTGGSIRICGYDVVEHPNEVRHRLGWMPDAYGTYDNTSVIEYLDFYGRAFGYKNVERRRRVDDVMEFTDLAVISDRPMNTLSKGMAQRLCLGRTLIHDPEVLVLDEPAAGLDPKARIEFKNLIRLLAGRGKTIFISSHILSELGEMCDQLLFIDAGRIVHHGDTASLRRNADAGVLVEVRTSGASTALVAWVQNNPGVAVVDESKDGARLRFDSAEPAFLAFNLRRMVMDGVEISGFSVVERRLEDAFVDILRDRERAK